MSRLITSARANAVAKGRASANTSVNNPPVWTTVPTVQFTRGVTVAESLTPYVTDPDAGQTVTISLLTGTLPSGVTLSGNAYNYNGTGAGATATGIRLRATDNGTDPLAADSNAHSIIVDDTPVWTSVPSVSFTELVARQVNLGLYVSNYSASTDEFQFNASSTTASWLTLTGTGGVLLNADGTQVDADDLTGVIIDVRRSGGAWVSSSAFGVTVSVAESGVATWVDWSEFSYAYGVDDVSVGNPTSANAHGNWIYASQPSLANEAAWQANNARQSDTSTAARLITPVWGAFFQPVWDDESPLVCVVPG